MVESPGDLHQLGAYTVVQSLTPGRSWLARDAGGRRLVLKAVEEDCLLRGQLHPNIHDRLARVRELAHPGVANLRGVERDGALTYLVWDYVPGITLEQYLTRPVGPPQPLIELARDLVLAVEQMHVLGIVHGAIHARNVFVDDAGAVRLTHVSPLLYHDPREDARALVKLLRQAETRQVSGHDEIAAALARLNGSDPDLRAIWTALAGSAADGHGELALHADEQSAALRRRSLIGAAGVLLIGAAVAWAILRAVG